MKPLLLVGGICLALAACGGEGAEVPDGADGEGRIDTAAAVADTGPASPSAADTSEVELVESPGAWAYPGQRDWTAGIVHAYRRNAPMTTLRSVRVARNDGYERFVIELGGDAVPGYHVEYVDRPVRQCGSGEPVDVEGDGWLQIRLEPARAHTEEGQPTIEERRLQPAQPIIREAVLICDFEGQVEWVLGVASPNPYRILELSSPARIVVDIRSD